MDRPLRLYEPNIIHNPFKWMGIWTPAGWRVHAMRRGQAERISVTLDGDGKSTFFPEVLCDPSTGRVEWQDDLHLADDPFTDRGLYPCDPRVEYPVGRPRWAISHTLLCYPFADHTLFTHEYVWDLTHGHLQTHFRKHVPLEEARTDVTSGNTVEVANSPISTSIEGNVCYPLPNSAVRGVWDNPEKKGINYYTQRVVQLLTMHNGVYLLPPKTPVVQCHGLYATSPDDPLETLFDLGSGLCVDEAATQGQLKIPLDSPRLGMLRFPVRQVESRTYEGLIGVPDALYGEIGEDHLDELHSRLGSRFEPGRVGYARDNKFDGDKTGAAGYHAAFDLDNDGEIGDGDFELVRQNLGRQVRYNLYLDAYFGGDWLTTSICVDAEHRPGVRVIADYEYGGGYDAQAGIVRLQSTPGPDRPVWVEYFHDAPAEAGEGNIRVHLYREPK